MEEPDPEYDHYRRRTLIAALAITAVCTQLTTILAMETDSTTDKETARWNEVETNQFIEFLVNHKSEGGDGGNFKSTTMRAAADHIAAYRTAGVVKEVKHMQIKWNALKTTFRAIITYRDTTSGTHWDDIRGANIEGDAAASSFNNYVKSSKANKPMAQFRNKGWVYFNQFEEIMPNSKARGSHAFSPMNAAPPSQLLEENKADGGVPGVETTRYVDGMQEDSMDVDKEADGSTLVSVSSAKRKLTTFTSDEDDTVSFTSRNLVPPSLTVSTSSIPSTAPSSEPSRKKSSASIATSSKSKSKAPFSRPSKAASSSSAHRSCAAKANAISPELLVHEMQGSINQLTATIRDSIDVDPVAKLRQEAVRCAMHTSEGLTDEQKKIIVNKFMGSHALAQVYLVLDDDVFRRDWLRDTCDES